MNKCIDSLGTAKLFSALEANSDYRKIELYKNDIDKKVFVTSNRLYRYTRMLFCLKTHLPPFSVQ